MILNEGELTKLTNFLSEERLQKLITLTGSRQVAIELHQETLRLGSHLMTVIATIEIALRNAACDNLTHHFALPNWLVQPPAPFQWRKSELIKVTAALDSARRAEYSKLPQSGKQALDALAYPKGRPVNKSHLERSKDRRKYIDVSHGKVVAELTLYFWKRLYGPEYEQSLWRMTLKRTFPYKKISRADVATNLELIYQARNRLAHHEPVLYARFNDTMKAVKFAIENLEQTPPTPLTPLAKLLEDDIAQVEFKASILHNKLASYRNSHRQIE